MLTRLRLENFKSWRELDMQLAPLTLLFGKNSSGKSSVLQALLLLKQTWNGVSQPINFGTDDHSYVNLGGFEDLVWKHNANLPLGISFTNQHNRDRTFDLDCDISWELYEGEVRTGHMEFKYPELTHKIGILPQENGKYWAFSENNKNDSIEVEIESGKILTSLGIVHDEELASRKAFKFHNITLTFNFSYEFFIRSIYYIGPLRPFPKRTYPWTSSVPSEINQLGENAVEMLISSERKEENGQASLLAQVSEWLQKLGLVENFAVEPLDKQRRFYEPRASITGTDSSLVDVGFGISQVLPIVVMLLSAPDNSIILLEQPELHLHPSAQSALGDLLLHVAEARHIQVIVESHSEHLLRRLQRRIAEPEHSFATPENIRMYFCEPHENGSILNTVNIEEHGQINNWPKGFFGDITGDLEAVFKAALEARQKEVAGD